MSGGIVVRRCESLAEFERCVALQREIWGEADLEVEPLTLFAVAARVGGQVLGAFDGQRSDPEKMIGYTLALPGVRNGAAYLHSHMTGILAAYRGRGVGRQLKVHQREEALCRGIRLIEWTFDPLETRNAHFNLNRLGALCRQYLPNLYGVTTSPLHRGLPTDRLVAEWHLDSARVAGLLSGKIPEPAEAPARIAIPAELEQWKQSHSKELLAVQARIREEFQEWFGRGYGAIGVCASKSGTEYLLAPGSEL